MGASEDVGKRGAITTSPTRRVGVNATDLEAEALGHCRSSSLLVGAVYSLVDTRT
jgi:hypothetical protein